MQKRTQCSIHWNSALPKYKSYAWYLHTLSQKSYHAGHLDYLLPHRNFDWIYVWMTSFSTLYTVVSWLHFWECVFMHNIPNKMKYYLMSIQSKKMEHTFLSVVVLKEIPWIFLCKEQRPIYKTNLPLNFFTIFLEFPQIQSSTKRLYCTESCLVWDVVRKSTCSRSKIGLHITHYCWKSSEIYQLKALFPGNLSGFW